MRKRQTCHATFPHCSMSRVCYLPLTGRDVRLDQRGEHVMEKYLNIMDGTIVIMLAAITAGLIHAIPAVL